MKPESLQFKNFQPYAVFLKHHHLEGLVKQDIQRSREVDLPLLKYFEHLDAVQLFELSKKGIVEYLDQIIQGTAVAAIIKSMQDWVDDKLEGVRKYDLVASDISLIYNVRKHSLIGFLPHYTNDLATAISVIKEIEDFYTFQESLAINTFSEIQKERISHTESLLLETQALANVGSYEWDILTDISTVTPEIKKIFGYNPDEVNSFQQFGEILHPADQAAVNEKLQQAFTTGETYIAEYRIYRKNDKKLRHVWTKGKVTFDHAGKPAKLVGVVWDITDRKLAEEVINRNEALLVEAQSIAHLGSWEWDTVNNSVSWSDELYRLFGYQPKEIDMNYEQYFSHIFPEDRELVSHHITQCFQQDKAYTFEHRILRKDGSIRWVHSKGQVYLKENGVTLKLAGTAIDITDQKQAAEAIRQKTEALVASNKELEAFCYTISHDLRSPLRAIDGFGKKLAQNYETALDAEGKRLLHIVRSNAQQMGSLIDALLDFSRLNRKDIKHSQLNMKHLIQGVLESIKQQQPDHKADVVLHELPDVSGDQDLMHQVWQNLISNAIKFTSKKVQPRIEIGCTRQESKLIYYIKDNGAGFQMDYKDKLFGVFQRLHTQEEFAGTGVGLATVQRIIHRHGGQVWAEATENEGATFFISFPASREILYKPVYS